MKKKLNIEVDISEKKYFTSKYNENTLAPELKDYLLASASCFPAFPSVPPAPAASE